MEKEEIKREIIEETKSLIEDKLKMFSVDFQKKIDKINPDVIKRDVLDEAITVINNRTGNTNAVDKKDIKLSEQYQDIFNKLRILDSWTFTGVKNIYTSVPSHVPKNKDEQIVFYKETVGTTSTYRLYLWIDDAWKAFEPTGTSSSSIVKSGNFTDDVTITGLDGDAAGIYELVIRANYTSAFNVTLQFNGDTGNNYHTLRHYDSKQAGTYYHDTDNVASATSIQPTFLSQKSFIIKLTINAKSGYHRTVTGIVAGCDNADTYRDLVTSAGFWTNTADNLTSIKIITGAIASGDYILYKIL